MARRRRASQLEMNFDGLTDSVTNLVGTLVLLIVLLVGVTTKAMPRLPAFSGGQGAVQAESLDPLLKQVETLRLRIRGLAEQASAIEAEVPELRGQVKALLDSDVAVPNAN